MIISAIESPKQIQTILQWNVLHNWRDSVIVSHGGLESHATNTKVEDEQIRTAAVNVVWTFPLQVILLIFVHLLEGNTGFGIYSNEIRCTLAFSKWPSFTL